MGPHAIGRCAATWAPVPFVPEVTLLTADQPWELWDASGRDAPPFWAFPWAGGQALARYVLDNPEVVRGRHVLDVASGSGLVAIAAAKAGAASVTAGDIDPDAVTAIRRNAAANKVAATVREIDMARDNAGELRWCSPLTCSTSGTWQGWRWPSCAVRPGPGRPRCAATQAGRSFPGTASTRSPRTRCRS
jgi:SAM-dependent methyltransferase